MRAQIILKLCILALVSGVFSQFTVAHPASFQNTSDVPFTLDPNGVSHLFWPFPNSSNVSPNQGTNGWQVSGCPGCGFHQGGDYYAEDWVSDSSVVCGVDFLSPLEGTVIFAGLRGDIGYGNQVVVRSSVDSSFAFRVAHLSEIAVLVGQLVGAGTKLGEIGTTGNSTGCHPHCVLYKNIYRIERLQQGLGLGFAAGGPTPFAALFDLDATLPGGSLPVLLSPEDGSQFVKGNEIIFDWQNVSGASFYEIWIDDKRRFSSPEVGFNNGLNPNWVNNGITSGTQFTLTVSMQNQLPQNLYYWYWKVRALDSNQSPITGWSQVTRFTLLDQPPAPTFVLFPNYPNPFNPETKIQYDIPKTSHTKIEIFNMLGQKIRTLVNENKPAGSFAVVWDGRTNDGESAASGVYIYMLKTDEFQKSRKLVLLR